MKTTDFIKRLDINYDIHALNSECKKLRNNVNAQGPLWAKQIALTHTSDCPTNNKWHQCIRKVADKKLITEKEITVINNELKDNYSYLWYVCNDMKSKFDIGRIRLSIGMNKSVYPMHRDWETRWMIPIESPFNSFIYFRLNENSVLDENILDSAHGFGFHMPVDGSVYEIFGANMHTGINCDEEQRIHLIFNAAYKQEKEDMFIWPDDRYEFINPKK